MRRAVVAYPLLALGLFLFCWINLPKIFSDKLRYWAVGCLSHLGGQTEASSESERLQLENQNLQAQIARLREWLLSEKRLNEQFEIYKTLQKEPSRPLLQRRMEHLRHLLLGELFSVPAQVVYRDPSSWSSSLWVNVGEDDNRSLGQTVIAKNSPVISDGALVGVVDYVGKKQTRVRLITDSGLSPAVRAARGPSFAEEYLAKGEIHGSSAPFWRSRSPILQGVGFNYDYPDDEGPARELKGDASILKEGDSLVTSGLDGVFPPGLRVGTVSWIASPREGSYAYEIEARPAAAHLNDLQTVFILPSLSE